MCDCCGETNVEMTTYGWGFAEYDACKKCADNSCFPMEEIFLDVSYGLSRKEEWAKQGLRTPVIMDNGCTVLRNGEYVTIKDVFDEFYPAIKEIAGAQGFKARLVEEFCNEHGFYHYKRIEYPMYERKDRIDQKDGTYVLNAVMSNEGYPDSKWQFVSGTLHDKDGTVLEHKEGK